MKRPRGCEPAGHELDDEWLEEMRAAVAPLELGQLGPYELLEEVSRGGQGIVYRAKDQRDRTCVAIKLLRSGLNADREARRRFERELDAARALEHPGIVRVLRMEESQGVPLILMEWIDGESVTDWAAGEREQGTRRPARELISVFLEVCDAVQYAHERGVLHRDLKPSNVLVDKEGRARLLDFGLAKRLESKDETSLTREGFLGTPAYASPEQLAGKTASLGVRSDVYSLGVVLFEMLTGARPYGPEGSAADATGSRGLRRFTGMIAGLDRGLGSILAEALALRPNDRYASAAELAADLRRVLAGERLAARAARPWHTLRLRARKHIRLLSSGALVLLTVLATALTLGLRGEPGEARAPEEVAHEALLHESLLSAGHELVFMRERLRGLAADTVELGPACVSAKEDGELLSTFLCGLAAVRVGEYSQALGTLRNVIEHAAAPSTSPVAASTASSRALIAAAARVSLGRILLATGRLDEAQRQLERALATLSASQQPRLNAEALHLLVRVLCASERSGRALEWLDAAAHEDLDAHARLVVSIARGVALTRAGRLEEALDTLLAAHEDSQHPGISERWRGEVRCELGALRLPLGDFRTADSHLWPGSKALGQALGAENPTTLSYRILLAHPWRLRGDKTRARGWLAPSVASLTKACGEDALVTARARVKLAMALRADAKDAEANLEYDAAERNYAAAEAEMCRALNGMERLLHRHHVEVLRLRQMLLRLRMRPGNALEAPELEDFLERWGERPAAAVDALDATVACDSAVLLALAGRWEAARPLAERGLAFFRAWPALAEQRLRRFLTRFHTLAREAGDARTAGELRAELERRRADWEKPRIAELARSPDAPRPQLASVVQTRPE